MIEMSPSRKNKISLSDYEYKRDIENRLLMSEFTTLDLDVLEEILYSSLSIPIRKLCKNLDLDEDRALPILNKLSKTGLFTHNGEVILVDKEMRKYYEAQILKFDEEFKPGMEFLRSMLSKVPIHVLPTWYSIPRTSNNIFDSLVEKYLLTPQTFQRYLIDLNFNDPILTGIIQDVYNSPELKVYSKDLIQKYGLEREQFEEYILHLEFNFICCLGYNKGTDLWKEVVTPFYEWTEYLRFLKTTESQTIKNPADVERYRPQDFSFIQDMSIILNQAKKQPIPLTEVKEDVYLPQKSALATILAKCENLNEKDTLYLERLIAKLRMIKLADIVDGRLYALEAANDWLDMRLENRALYVYRHPLNRLVSQNIPAYLCTDRNIREAEKSILRVLTSGWLYFDEFVKGALVVLGEGSTVTLKRLGKNWKYTLPDYSDEELKLLKATILEWLFEVGIVSAGTHQGKECFCVTAFGQSLFGR
jgi:hypothetical protein